MNNSIVEISNLQQSLSTIKEPKQSKAVEVIAAVEKARAKEQGDYEAFVAAAYLYVMARRKTTELLLPVAPKKGGDRKSQDWNQSNNDVTLIFDFTKMQWSRRVKELMVSQPDIDSYFDECIERHWEPTVYGLMRYTLNPHVSFNSGESEWYTPPEYIAAAKEVMREIDLDPASSEKANEIVGAKEIYTEETDGLKMDNEWTGRVWLNAPYDGRLKLFIARYAASVRAGKITEGIVLVNNATETEWFGSLVSVSSAVVFTTGRIKFLNEQLIRQDTPLQGQAFLYAGSKPDKFIAEFSKFGWSAKL